MTDEERQERKARDNDPILKIESVLKILKIRRKDTLLGYVKDGKLKASKIAGHWSFRKSWVDEFHDVTCRYVTKAQQQESDEGLPGVNSVAGAERLEG